MAIVNKVWREGTFVPPGAEPGLTQKFVWRDIDQEKAVGDIARLRFDFPNMQQPGLKTFTNRPARQIGVRLDESGKEMAFPDIVVVTDPANEVAMIGEVETHRTLRDLPEEQLVEKWRAFAGLGDLFLFVPMMEVSAVKQMLKRHALKKSVTVRSWRYITGQNLLDVADVK